MSDPGADLANMLRALNPVLNEGVYVFASLPEPIGLGEVDFIATFREAEGLTVVLEEEQAQKAKLPVFFRAAWITLEVCSDLNAIGLTAAFSAALAEAGISCNVMAAANHDHIFVPIDSAREALHQLEGLQNSAQAETQS